MLETSARLLRLLTLLGTRRFWSGIELAQRLEVTERTVRRDIDKLRSLGYPVSSSTGLSGGYALGAGGKLPPLLLDADEAVAVALGLHSAAAGTVSGMEEAAMRALAKFDQVLPRSLRRRIGAVQASVAALSTAGPRIDAGLLMALASACRDEEIVSFRYADAKGRMSQRRVEPHGLVHAGSRWYLAAWDLEREAFRTFRLDRASDAKPLGRRFVRRQIPEGSVTAYVSRSVSTDAYAHSVRVVLHASYEAISSRVSPLAARLTPLADHRCLLEAGGGNLGLIGVYVACLGVDFEVLEPPEFAKELRALSRRLARAARSAPAGS